MHDGALRTLQRLERALDQRFARLREEAGAAPDQLVVALDRDVEEAQRFLETAQFDYVGVFVYSPEEGTRAGAMPDQFLERLPDADDADEAYFEAIGERLSTKLGRDTYWVPEGPDKMLTFVDANGEIRGRSGPLSLLVVGGSLGARVLNETVPEAIARLDAGSGSLELATALQKVGTAAYEPDLVNQPQTQGELEALRMSVARGQPFGVEGWRAKTAKRLGLEFTLRPRGRPRARGRAAGRRHQGRGPERRRGSAGPGRGWPRSRGPGASRCRPARW